MNGPLAIPEPEKQHAVASWIVGVVFNYFALCYDRSYFRRTNHSVGTRHLSNGMWQKKQSVLCLAPDDVRERGVHGNAYKLDTNLNPSKTASLAGKAEMRDRSPRRNLSGRAC
jgi:hypothetical protein